MYDKEGCDHMCARCLHVAGVSLLFLAFYHIVIVNVVSIHLRP
jgi:hypothetical protein